ncbi:adenylate/guanylate cyclase domain-containing protein, partial [Patescibacteria group bacterium]|nr:adenylate/guanylate cyclase domain-containing protein [Patescibacteria group bacterium]
KVSPAQLKIMQYYAQGLELYRARNFVEALKVFEGIVKTAPYDWPSKIFTERCRIMSASKNAPVDGWDGVFDIRGK